MRSSLLAGALGLPLLAGAALLITTPTAWATPIGPNVTTVIGPGFDLVTRQPGPIGVPTLPAVQFGLNPTDCGANCPASSLDLSNPATPVLKQPGPAGDNFSIFWGMVNPGPQNNNFVYSLPSGITGGTFDWTATELNSATGLEVATFSGAFTLSSPTAISYIGERNPGPTGFGDSFELMFATASDPDLSFSLTEGGQPLSFASVPEPASALLFGVGLAPLGGMSRKRRRVGLANS